MYRGACFYSYPFAIKLSNVAWLPFVLGLPWENALLI
jgi:hypothetical protein